MIVTGSGGQFHEVELGTKSFKMLSMFLVLHLKWFPSPFLPTFTRCINFGKYEFYDIYSEGLLPPSTHDKWSIWLCWWKFRTSVLQTISNSPRSWFTTARRRKMKASELQRQWLWMANEGQDKLPRTWTSFIFIHWQWKLMIHCILFRFIWADVALVSVGVVEPPADKGFRKSQKNVFVGRIKRCVEIVKNNCRGSMKIKLIFGVEKSKLIDYWV